MAQFTKNYVQLAQAFAILSHCVSSKRSRGDIHRRIRRHGCNKESACAGWPIGLRDREILTVSYARRASLRFLRLACQSCLPTLFLQRVVLRARTISCFRKGTNMANIKSQKKRNITNEKAHQRNKACKSELKTAVRRVREAVAAGNGAEAYAAALAASRLLDKAASKGIIHKNQAANRKSGVMQLANTIVTDADRAAYVKPEPKKQEATGNKKAAKKAERKAALAAASAEKAKRREKQLKEEAAAKARKAKEAEEAAKAEAAEAEEAAE